MQTIRCVAWLAALSALAGTQTSPSVPAVQRPLFDLLHVTDAWKVSRGAGCRLGIVDVGFDYFHPALWKALMPGFHADGVFHSDAAPIVAHGTAVASVIVARQEPDGMIGLAPECEAVGAAQGMPEHTLALLQQALAREGRNSPEDLRAAMADRGAEIRAFTGQWLAHVAGSTADAMRSLVDGGARVINISEFLSMALVGRDASAASRVEEAFAYAAAHDVLVIIGAGNTGARVDTYPGAGLPVLVVGASTLADTRWTLTATVAGATVSQGSCTGPRLSVVAPAERVMVAEPHDPALFALLHTPMGPASGTFAGAYRVTPVGATSIASAVVAGLGSLVRAARPDLDAAAVAKAIEDGARDIGVPGRDDETGHGVVDFGRTMALLGMSGR